MSQSVQNQIIEEMDFAALLEESFKEGLPGQGDIVNGTILAIDQQGLLIDVGLKKDGVVTKNDLERLGDHVAFELGQTVPVVITHMEDRDGNLQVSLSQALQAAIWEQAEQLFEASEAWEGPVVESNRGGIIVAFESLRGFVPASHLVDIPRGVSEDERQTYMKNLVGEKIAVKVIEVNRRRRRLVFSQREAVHEERMAIKENLMEALKEGDVRSGVVSGLRDFGAFVDLGGADGLIHISELAWHRVQHPREVVAVGDKVDVYIMHLDVEEKRIGLSLKRLQDNPWEKIDDFYHIGQLVLGEVSRVEPYGAFVRLDPGIEALLHGTQITGSNIEDVDTFVQPGQKLLLRIISIEPERQRLGLSWNEVTELERENWASDNDHDVASVTIDVPQRAEASETDEEPLESLVETEAAQA